MYIFCGSLRTKNVCPIIVFGPISYLPVNICISKPLRTLLTQTSHVISAFHEVWEWLDSHRVPQTNSSHLLQFLLNQNNKLMLCLRHCITVITRWQPMMFYPELFAFSDMDLCISMATLSMSKWICSHYVVQVSCLEVVYIYFYCNVMCFEIWSNLTPSLMTLCRLCPGCVRSCVWGIAF